VRQSPAKEPAPALFAKPAKAHRHSADKEWQRDSPARAATDRDAVSKPRASMTEANS
jgi:hypothetical protein